MFTTKAEHEHAVPRRKTMQYAVNHHDQRPDGGLYLSGTVVLGTMMECHRRRTCGCRDVASGPDPRPRPP